MKKIGAKIYLAVLLGVVFLAFINLALIAYFNSVSSIVEKQIDVDRAAHDVQKINTQISVGVVDVKSVPDSGLDTAVSDFNFLLRSFEEAISNFDKLPELESIKEEIVEAFDQIKTRSDKIFVLERSLRIRQANLSKELADMDGFIKNIPENKIDHEISELLAVYRLSEINFFEDVYNSDSYQSWLNSGAELVKYLNKKNIPINLTASDYLLKIDKIKINAIETNDLMMLRNYNLTLLQESFININFEGNEIINLSNKNYQSIISANEAWFKKSIFGVFFAFLINIILMVLIVKSIVRPIEVLTKAAVEVSKGNMTNRAEVKSKDEIGYLASVFNEMLGDIEAFQKTVKENQNNLKNLNSNLEIKIAERTKELEQIKDKLEEMVKERTAELQSKIKELEKFRDLTVGREVKMINLKKELADVKKMLKV